MSGDTDRAEYDPFGDRISVVQEPPGWSGDTDRAVEAGPLTIAVAALRQRPEFRFAATSDDFAAALRAALSGSPRSDTALDVERVKQAVTNIARRHNVAKDPPPPDWSLMRLFGYTAAPAVMDAEIAAEYARLSSPTPEQP